MVSDHHVEAEVPADIEVVEITAAAAAVIDAIDVVWTDMLVVVVKAVVGPAAAEDMVEVQATGITTTDTTDTEDQESEDTNKHDRLLLPR